MTNETKIKEDQISNLSHNIEIQKDDSQQVAEASTINFEGDVSVTDEGSGKATVTISGSGSGGDIEVQEDDVQKLSAATVLNFEGDATVTDEGGGKATITVTTSGSSGGTPDFSWWNPYASPDSGSSYDDEFSDEAGAGAPSGWTEYDQSGCLSISETERGLTFTKSSTTQEIGGVYKTCPSSTNYTVYTKVDIQQYQTGDTQAGIFFTDNMNNPTTTDHEFWGIYIGSAGYGVRHAVFSDYNSSSTENSQIHAPPIGVGMFLRARVYYVLTEYRYYLGYSFDGKTWFDVYNYAQSFTPNTFGLFLRSNQGVNEVIVNFPFFRVDTSSGNTDSQLPSNRVNGFLTS